MTTKMAAWKPVPFRLGQVSKEGWFGYLMRMGLGGSLPVASNFIFSGMTPVVPLAIGVGAAGVLWCVTGDALVGITGLSIAALIYWLRSA